MNNRATALQRLIGGFIRKQQGAVNEQRVPVKASSVHLFCGSFRSDFWLR